LGDEVLTSEELAEWLGVATDTIRYEARRGRLPGRKVGKEWRFSKEAILEWLSTQEPLGRWAERDGDDEDPVISVPDLTEALHRALEASKKTQSQRD
jgi:excisionase family DNA binding protein